MKTIKIFCIVLVSLFLFACEAMERPAVRDSNILGLQTINRNSVYMREAIRDLKDNMVFFRKNGKCFAVVFSRTAQSFAVPSITQISCDGVEEIPPE
jgi:hypothetical protein